MDIDYRPRRCRTAVRSKFERTEPLSIGLKQLEENEAGIGRPCMGIEHLYMPMANMMMMMMMRVEAGVIRHIKTDCIFAQHVATN